MATTLSNVERPATIVFAATDLSASSNEALRQAHERARSEGSALIVCHVVPNHTNLGTIFEHPTQEQTEEQVLHSVIERTCQATGRVASEFQAVVDRGDPYSRIVERAEQLRADIIVVGHRSGAGFSRLVGHVAERVTRYARSAVLIARPCAKTGRMLVATDLTDPSLPAIGAAAREAHRSRAQVTALHCVEPAPAFAGTEYALACSPAEIREFTEQVRDTAQRDLGNALRRFELQGHRRIVEGAPSSSILKTAEELGVELIILGTRGRTGLRRLLLGSVAEKVIRHARCSVLVVRLTEGPILRA